MLTIDANDDFSEHLSFAHRHDVLLSVWPILAIYKNNYAATHSILKTLSRNVCCIARPVRRFQEDDYGASCAAGLRSRSRTVLGSIRCTGTTEPAGAYTCRVSPGASA